MTAPALGNQLRIDNQQGVVVDSFSPELRDVVRPLSGPTLSFFEVEKEGDSQLCRKAAKMFLSPKIFDCPALLKTLKANPLFALAESSGELQTLWNQMESGWSGDVSKYLLNTLQLYRMNEYLESLDKALQQLGDTQTPPVLEARALSKRWKAKIKVGLEALNRKSAIEVLAVSVDFLDPKISYRYVVRDQAPTRESVIGVDFIRMNDPLSTQQLIARSPRIVERLFDPLRSLAAKVGVPLDLDHKTWFLSVLEENGG